MEDEEWRSRMEEEEWRMKNGGWRMEEEVRRKGNDEDGIGRIEKVKYIE
jgi:hypothetical protein